MVYTNSNINGMSISNIVGEKLGNYISEYINEDEVDQRVIEEDQADENISIDNQTEENIKEVKLEIDNIIKEEDNEEEDNEEDNKEKDIKNVPGLSSFQNIGNTCYMNSVLQCLINCDLLKSYFLLEHYKNKLKINIFNDLWDNKEEDSNKMRVISQSDYRKRYKNSLTKQFGEIVIQYWNFNNKIIPSKFKKVLGKLNNDFSGNSQEDSEQFLSYLLEKIHDETKNDVKSVIITNDNEKINKLIMLGNKCKDILNNKNITEENKILTCKIYKNYMKLNIKDTINLNGRIYWKKYLERENDSIIRDLFTGLFLSNIRCTECLKNSFSFEPFNILNIPIEKCNDDINLENCFFNFTKKEILDESNRYYCKKCKKHVNAEKRIYIWKEPEILIIQLKRFSSGSYLSKINTNIIYPIKDLSISKLCYNTFNDTYNLSSVVKHYGNLFGGHYKSVSLNKINNEWYEYNDDDIYHILDTNLKKDVISNSAYILFYEKKYKQ